MKIDALLYECFPETYIEPELFPLFQQVRKEGGYLPSQKNQLQKSRCKVKIEWATTPIFFLECYCTSQEAQGTYPSKIQDNLAHQ